MLAVMTLTLDCFLQNMLQRQHGIVRIYAKMWIGKQQHTIHSCSPRVLGAPLHVEFDGQRISQCSDAFAGQPGIQGSIIVVLTIGITLIFVYHIGLQFNFLYFNFY